MERSRIEEVVGDFVNLKRRGSNLTGLCPFHHEKTPSFSVSPTRNIFKCFGCGRGGDSVKFVMEHEGYDYPKRSASWRASTASNSKRLRQMQKLSWLSGSGRRSIKSLSLPGSSIKTSSITQKKANLRGLTTSRRGDSVSRRYKTLDWDMHLTGQTLWSGRC
jgi:hypothetical protein